MKVETALEYIYLSPLNQKSIDENVKDVHYIKHIISDVEDKEYVSTMLAMLSKLNFVSMLYFSTNKTIESKQIISKLSKYFVESVLVEVLNTHLNILSEPLLSFPKPNVEQPSKKELSSENKQQMPSKKLISVPAGSKYKETQEYKDIQLLIQLDINAYQKYELAKQQKTPLTILEAKKIITQLIQMHDYMKKTYTVYNVIPKTINLKNPKYNLKYLNQLQQQHTSTPYRPAQGTPPNKYKNVNRQKKVKKHKFFRLISTETDFNIVTLLFGTLMVFPLGLLNWIPSWWILWTVLLIPLFIVVGIVLFLSLFQEFELPLLPVFFLGGSIFGYMLLGPSSSLLIERWESFLALLPSIGIWTAGIITGLLLWYLLRCIYFDFMSPRWFWVITVISGIMLLYIQSLEWYLFAAIISSALVLSSLIAFIYDMIDSDGIGIFGLLVTIYFGYFAYEYFLNYGFFQ